MEKEKYLKAKKPIREHLDMVELVTELEKEIAPMKLTIITKEKVRQVINKLKRRKAAGSNKLKPELYIEIAKSEICLETIAKCFNNVLQSKNVPAEWKQSRTKLIAKKRKPTVKDFRPISLTNISYKIFMSIIKEEIEQHLVENHLTKENQTGFTKGGRIEDNLFTLQFLARNAAKRKKVLVVTSIDYSKAYDSIDRRKMIETMIEYKIHPYIIDTVANLYQDDYTTINIGEKEKRINISSGIKQGCTGSTTFFKLITYMIMSRLEKDGKGVQIDNLNIHSLFYADDSLTLSSSIKNAQHNIKIMKEVSKTFGLEINKEKSKILLFNCKEKVEEIEGIKVVDKIKYLGVEISSNTDIFKTHKEEIIKRAGNLANMTYSIISKSCNKMLIGKTYWKCVVLPSLLQCIGVMTFTKEQIEKLQVIENTVYRKILGARFGTSNCILRGEIGASSMEKRMIENTLTWVKSIHEGSNDLTKEILRKIRMEKNREGKASNAYNTYLNNNLKKVNLKYEDIMALDKNNIRNKVKAWDTEKWTKEIGKLETVEIYRSQKSYIMQETCYDNTHQ